MTDTPNLPRGASDELVERVARALYACEKERSDRCDAVLSVAKGKTVTVGMEPWEECWQSFHDDARAVIATLSTPEAEEEVCDTCGLPADDPQCECGYDASDYSGER